MIPDTGKKCLADNPYCLLIVSGIYKKNDIACLTSFNCSL